MPDALGEVGGYIHYIYIERERERERKFYVYVYVYLYIYMYICIYIYIYMSIQHNKTARSLQMTKHNRNSAIERPFRAPLRLRASSSALAAAFGLERPFRAPKRGRAS